MFIQSIKKEYQRVVSENNHLKKRNEQLEQYIIKEERKKQEYSFKIKYTESSGSEDEYQYCCKKPSKQRKNKQKYHGYESYDDEDYSNGPRVKQNKRKNYYYEDDNNSQNKKDDDNSLNKKDTKKRRYQQEECEDYCDGDNDETSDNDIDKTNKKNTIWKRE